MTNVWFNENVNFNDNENRKLIDNVRGRSLVEVLALASVPLGRAKVAVDGSAVCRTTEKRREERINFD